MSSSEFSTNFNGFNAKLDKDDKGYYLTVKFKMGRERCTTVIREGDIRDDGTSITPYDLQVTCDKVNNEWADKPAPP